MSLSSVLPGFWIWLKKFSAAFVCGYQGNDISSPLKNASYVKHFAGYGVAKDGRDYDSTQIGEYSL